MADRTYPDGLFTRPAEELFNAVQHRSYSELREINPRWVDRLRGMDRLSKSDLASPYSNKDIEGALSGGLLPEATQLALESVHDLYMTASYLEFVSRKIEGLEAESDDFETAGLRIDFLCVSWHVWAYALVDKTKAALMRRDFTGDSIEIRTARSDIESEFRRVLSTSLSTIQVVRDPALHIVGQIRGTKQELTSPSRAITKDKLWDSNVALGVTVSDSIVGAHQYSGQYRIPFRRKAMRVSAELISSQYSDFVEFTVGIIQRQTGKASN